VVITPPIPADTRTHIERVLATTANHHGVRILYAAESGSRAWGFGSPDSDYDVRFIYAHSQAWYLRLKDERDVIEAPLDAQLVDLAGWDVRKALRLMLRSNPAFYEWLCSPIVYSDAGEFRASAKSLFERHANRNAIARHYYSIATHQWKQEIDGRERVKLKKYLYIIRPLLSLQWVATHATPPPMAISDLLAASELPTAVRVAIDALIVRKRTTPELGSAARLVEIDNWAIAEFRRSDPAKLALPGALAGETELEADALFQRTIAAWPQL
jgi:uncharacterized protein